MRIALPLLAPFALVGALPFWGVSSAGCDGSGGSAGGGGGGPSGGDLGTTPEADWGVGGGTGGVAWLEVGTGTEHFEALTPGQEVSIIEGPQGGYHVWGALQAGGVNPKGVTMHFQLMQGGAVLGEASYLDDLFRAEPGAPWSYTRVAVVLLDGTPDAVAPGAAILRVDLTQAGGASLTDEIEIVPVCCQ